MQKHGTYNIIESLHTSSLCLYIDLPFATSDRCPLTPIGGEENIFSNGCGVNKLRKHETQHVSIGCEQVPGKSQLVGGINRKADDAMPTGKE